MIVAVVASDLAVGGHLASLAERHLERRQTNAGRKYFCLARCGIVSLNATALVPGPN